MNNGAEFSADKSILGFKYQIRYALYLLFDAQRCNGLEVSIDIERIDDIDVRAAGKVTKLVQTKDTATVLTNSSKPLWKTIRIWAEAIRLGAVDVDKIREFNLVTTSSGPTDDDAIVALMQSGDDDARQRALRKMRSLAAAKRNLRTLGPAYRAFDDLTASMQEKLISKIRIITNAFGFDELDDCIRQQIVQGPPGKQIPFSQVLFGRWDILVENYLREGKKAAISWDDLQAVLWEISKEFEEDNLPTEFAGMLRDAFPLVSDDQRTFVQQLVVIGGDEKQIQRAQRTYLKATQLVGFWLRNVIIRPDEVAAHAARLVDECEIQHESAKLVPELSKATAMQLGMRIYKWALMDAPYREALRIRPRCCDLDVIRGCLHDLADRRRLGWHPDWFEIFRQC